MGAVGRVRQMCRGGANAHARGTCTACGAARQQRRGALGRLRRHGEAPRHSEAPRHARPPLPTRSSGRVPVASPLVPAASPLVLPARVLHLARAGLSVRKDGDGVPSQGVAQQLRRLRALEHGRLRRPHQRRVKDERPDARRADAIATDAALHAQGGRLHKAHGATVFCDVHALMVAARALLLVERPHAHVDVDQLVDVHPPRRRRERLADCADDDQALSLL